MKTTTWMLLILFVIGPATAKAQLSESFLPGTVDGRNAAMGRTSIASPTGSNTLLTNPAGLGILTDMEAQAGGRFLIGFINDDLVEDDIRYASHAKLNSLSLATPYQLDNSDIKLAFGIGYRTYHDFGFKLVAEDDDDKFTDDVSGGLNTLSPAVAANIQDRYFVGIAYKYNRSIRSTITEEVEFNGNDGPAVEVETSGSFFLLGGLAHLTPAFTVGLMYRSAFDWEWEMDEGTARSIHPRLSGTAFDFEFPSLFGIGAAYDLASDLTVVGEYQNRPFSDYEVEGQPFLNIDDGFSLRLGLEKQGNVPIRLGFFRDSILDREIDDDAPLALLGLTGGLGFDLGTIVLDTALEAARWNASLGDGDDESEILFRVRATVRYTFDRSLDEILSASS